MIKNRIIIYNNEKVIIENYKAIIDLSNNYIIVDKYYIKGENIKIKEMDDYYINIFGNIKTIEFLSDKL